MSIASPPRPPGAGFKSADRGRCCVLLVTMASRNAVFIALAAFVCAASAAPSGGFQSEFKCDYECQKRVVSAYKIVTECREKTGSSKEEIDKYDACSDDVPLKVQNYYACTAEKIGLLDGNRKVNMQGWEKIGQEMDDGCAKAEASGDEDATTKKICDHKAAFKASLRGCIEEGKKQEKEGDNGVGAIMAIRKCSCHFQKKQ